MTVLVGQFSLLLRHVYHVLYDCTCRSVFTTTETRLSCIIWLLVGQYSLLLRHVYLVLYDYLYVSIHYYRDTSILYYMTVLVDQCSLLLRHVYLVLYDYLYVSIHYYWDTSILYYMTVLVSSNHFIICFIQFNWREQRNLHFRHAVSVTFRCVIVMATVNSAQCSNVMMIICDKNTWKQETRENQNKFCC